jgi:hypothetical protein
VQLTLVLDPDTEPQRSPVVSGYYDNYLLNLYKTDGEISGGDAIATFVVLGHGLYDVGLIFDRVRTILAAQFNNPFQIEGSSDYLAVLAQSRLYVVCQPLVPGYSTPTISPGLASNVEEFNVTYDPGTPPSLIPNIDVKLSLFFEDF